MTLSMSSTGSRWGALGYRKLEDKLAMRDERMGRGSPARETRRAPRGGLACGLPTDSDASIKLYVKFMLVAGLQQLARVLGHIVDTPKSQDDAGERLRIVDRDPEAVVRTEWQAGGGKSLRRR